MTTKMTGATNSPVGENNCESKKITPLREIGAQIAALERAELLAEQNEALVRAQRDAVANALYGIYPDEIERELRDLEEGAANDREEQIFPPIRAPRVIHRSFKTAEYEEADPSTLDL